MVAKAKRKARKEQQYHNKNNFGFQLRNIKPKTYAQEQVFEGWHQNNLFLSGCAGTGKTFLAIYLALREVFEGDGLIKKVVLFRSAVPSRDIGFLPGTEEEKLAVYEPTYRAIVNDLIGRGDAYDILKQKGVIEFRSTSFARGTTIDNAVIILEEVQNCSAGESYTILTRVGQYSRVIVAGDLRQTDLARNKSGLPDLIKIIEAMKSFEKVEFQVCDIVRSDFVRELIQTRIDLEDRNVIQPLAV